MGDKTEAFGIFQTPLSSHYPLPLTSIKAWSNVDTVGSERRQMKQSWINDIKRKKKKSPSMCLQNFLIAFVLKSRFASDQYPYRTEYSTCRINQKNFFQDLRTSHSVQDRGVQCMHILNTEKRNDFLEMTAETFFHILARTQIFPVPR